MPVVPKARNARGAKVRSDRGALLGLLAVYVILITVFWHMLVVPPFGIGSSSGAAHAMSTAVSVSVSAPRPLVVDQSPPSRVSSTERTGGSVSVVSDWIHVVPTPSH
ncbi:MAG TPA: hypothetical protein VMW65_18570 [Chloroflexota bacterium]|nr:hypothetical protein [Chloroflexota bacterium]